LASTGSGASRIDASPVERWYVLAVLAIFLMLSLRLFYMQVITGNRYRLASWDNIIQTVDTPAPRGDIFDRAGRPLAKNINIFQLLYIPPKDIEKYFAPEDERARLAAAHLDHSYLRTDRETDRSLPEIERLAAYLGTTYVELMKRVEAERRRVFSYQPVMIVPELTQQQVVYLGEHADEYDGVLIEQYAFKRVYPLASNAAHLVGYTARISEKDAETFVGLRYGPRDYVGKEGIERQYEQLLHGNAGSRDIEVDRNRVFCKIVRQVKPTKGADLYLTIDANIQAEAQRVLGGRPGALIISNLQPGHEGEIVALAASPGFDPNQVRKSEYYARLLSDPRKPLLNRAYRHAYPPGSTFKIVTSTAALQEKTITPGKAEYCPGFLMIGNRKFKCHHAYGHGTVSLLAAIAQSCDVYFYNTGMDLPDPPTTLKHYAELFGLGSPVGLELPNEVKGTVPDAQWKHDHFISIGYTRKADWDWYRGDTANYSIGQGFLTATPLQVLWMSNLVATNGLSYPPRLLYAKTADGRVLPTETMKPIKHPLSEEALSFVKQGMRMAATSGTCKSLNLSGMSVCAKTGTAETGIAGKADHSWVTGFYPMNKPKYGFVVFCENGGLSSAVVVPEARQMLQFLKKYKPAKDVS
jgi:penicillin-binding protein 2